MDIDQILNVCKSKRYPMSTLRRILWSAALGITDALQQQPVEHLWVLGANERGFEMLANGRNKRKERGIDAVVTPKFADYAKAVGDIAVIEQNAADIRALCCFNPMRWDLYRSNILR